MHGLLPAMKPRSTPLNRALRTGLLGLLLAPLATAAEQRPNILFIFTDDHAPHAIGAYDGWLKEVAPTPNIDALANSDTKKKPAAWRKKQRPQPRKAS